MKLTYRGVSYEVAPAQLTDTKFHSASVRQNEKAKTQALNAILRYRGATYQVQPTVETAAQPVATNAVLTYRGVQYRVQPTTQPVAVAAEVVTTAQPALSIEDQARFLVQNHHRATKQRQQAILSRAATEVGLTGDLTQYWNHIQGKVHSSFWATYDRSHVALS